MRGQAPVRGVGYPQPERQNARSARSSVGDVELLLAAVSGLVAGATLLVGAGLAWFIRIPGAIVAGVMAFGAGVLISALAFELVAEAHRDGGLGPTVLGFAIGAVLYVAADALLNRRGASHRKNAGDRQTAEADRAGSGTALFVGALVDGIPESIVLGLSVAATGGLSTPIVAAIAISNLPEGLSSTAGMKAAGRSARYVALTWTGALLATVLSAVLGYLALRDAGPATIAVITTVAAGGILAMVCNTMIPEAFAEDRRFTGLLATLGFLAAFALSASGA